jgi:glycine cleavage system H protein
MFYRITSRVIKNYQIRTLSSSKILKKKIYTPNEEWILHTMESTQIGITKNAQDQLGELVYIDFSNQKGDIIKKDEELVTIESVKATESINAPFDCVLLANNLSLEEDLDVINQNPEDTWIVKVDEIP